MKTAALFAIAALAVAGPVRAQEHEHHHPEPVREPEAASAPEVETPSDHVADSVFAGERMETARDQLFAEHGGALSWSVLVDLLEYQLRSGDDAFRWEGEGWFGGDVNRLVAKSEGEVELGEEPDEAELHLVYSRAISPYFDLQIGGRYDFEPNPQRGYAVLGFEGLAPYWFQIAGALFVSNEGDVLARLEGYHDLLLTQRLVAQPRAELNFAAQDVSEHEIGAGLSDFELALRVRYEIRRELAPYLGVEWKRRVGESADRTRDAGDPVGSVSFVAGMRLWF